MQIEVLVWKSSVSVSIFHLYIGIVSTNIILIYLIRIISLFHFVFLFFLFTRKLTLQSQK